MVDDPLKHPRAELRAASRAIEAMKNARDLDDFEAAWRQALSCIEKAWTKTERCCQPHRARFEPWQARYHGLRRKDMLLRYLKQARDADNHSVQDLARIEPGSRGMRFADRRGGYIKHMEIRNGQVVSYEGDPVIIEERLPRLVAVPVKNHGEWFNPPTSHLGNPVVSLHPVHLAELGVRFYDTFLNEVQATFFSTAA